MIRHTALLPILVVAILFAQSASASPQFSSPSATLTAAVGDTQITHTFPFTTPAPGSDGDPSTGSGSSRAASSGDKPLPGVTLTAIKTSCGCTTAKLDKTTYAPGESGHLTATFIIGDRTGEQTKHIRVHWKEGDGPEQVTTLTMKVTIPEVLRITPRFLYWRPADAKTAKTVDVRIGDSQTFKITGAKSSTDDVTTEVKAVEEGKRYTLTVTPTATDQPLRSVITLTTDNPAIPATKLTLHARLIPTRETASTVDKNAPEAMTVK